MIPNFNTSGVLPPFDPAAAPTDRNSVAPYRTTMLEIARRFCSSDARIAIMRGLITYRAELRASGIVDGFQWIDGSFVEDCENIRSRPPEDVDLITFAARPAAATVSADWTSFVGNSPHLFHPGTTKTRFKCDAYYVDLALRPVTLVNNSRYWFGLFSHQRDTFLWKGLLEVSLQDDDTSASALLDQGGSHAS